MTTAIEHVRCKRHTHDDKLYERMACTGCEVESHGLECFVCKERMDDDDIVIFDNDGEPMHAECAYKAQRDELLAALGVALYTNGPEWDDTLKARECGTCGRLSHGPPIKHKDDCLWAKAEASYAAIAKAKGL